MQATTHVPCHSPTTVARLFCVLLPQMMETPLIRTAHNGHFRMVKFLIDHRADVNAIDLVLTRLCTMQRPSGPQWSSRLVHSSPA